MRKNRNQNNKKTYRGILDFSNKKDPFINCVKIAHHVKLGSSIINYLHGDLVEFEILSRKRKGFYLGNILGLIERKKKEYIGVIQTNKNYAFTIIEDRNVYTDVFIPSGNIGNAHDGDKVLIKILDWKKQDLSPIGKVEQILGKPGEHTTEIDSILSKNSIEIKFSEEVNEFTKNISEKIPETEIGNRRDFRNTLTFTIDPTDAKDFDDALSYKKLENNNLEVGIHIADVSH